MIRYIAAASFALLIAMPSAARAADCTHTNIGKLPIQDLGVGSYMGEQGGLYPGGSNTPPPGYLARGVAASQAIQPINGKIGVISSGMSSAMTIFDTFITQANADARKRPEVVFVNGAQNGADIDEWSLGTKRWRALSREVRAAGMTDSQVQAMWMYHGEPNKSQLNNGIFPGDEQILHTKFLKILQLAEAQFPNLRHVWIADHPYVGYSNLGETWLGYDSQWGVKWTVEDSVTGAYPGRAFIGWGFPQWTDGTAGRSDGFTWQCSDSADDGVHPSASGRAKLAQGLLNQYLSDPSTGWFRR